jgi:hypothetical protein
MIKVLEFLLCVVVVAFIAFTLALWVLDMSFAQYFEAVIKFYF